MFIRFFLAFLLMVVLLSTQPAQAGTVDPKTFAPHYVHEVFGVDDGLPKAGFSWLAKTPDGYLWIATFAGLARFDGAHFRTFDVTSHPALGSSRIETVFVDAEGVLWILAESGHLSRRRYGRIEGCELPSHGASAACDSTEAGPPAFDYLFKGPTGSVWVTGLVSGLFEARDNLLTSVGTLEDSAKVSGLYLDPFEKLWAFTGSNIWLRTAQGFRRFTHDLLEPPPYTLAMIAVASDASLWMKSRGVVGRVVVGGEGEEDRLEPVVSADDPWAPWVVSDPLGHLWIADYNRLFHHRNGELILIAEDPKPLPAIPRAHQMAVDSEGHTWILWRNLLIRAEGKLTFPLVDEIDQLGSLWIEDSGVIWVASSRGSLHALYPSEVENLVQGLSSPSMYAVFEEQEGGYRVGEERPALFDSESGHFEESPCPTDQLQCPARAFARDGDGALWIGFSYGSGLWRVLPDGSFQGPFNPEGTVLGVIQTLESSKDGALWVGTPEGLYRFGATADPAFWASIPLRESKEPKVRVVHEMADGSLWLGTQTSGLFHWSEGSVHHFHRKNGFPSDMIRSIWQDPDGYLWVSTETAGLVRLDPRSAADPAGLRVAKIGEEQGLPLNSVHHVVADDFGDLWLSSNEGIFRGRYTDFREAADGKHFDIPLTVYTERNGMLSREANGGNSDAGIKDLAGRIVFPTQSGLARFDPQREWPPEPLPSAFVDSLHVGEQDREVDAGPVILGPEARSFSIDYSAPFLRSAENLKFRIRLLPYDDDWVEVGNRRTAFYTRVPPGQYRFEVTVAHQGLPHRGQWNPDPASLTLHLIPRFYETRLFAALCVLLTLALIGGSVRWWIGHLRRQAVQLEQTISERTATIREQAEKLRQLDQVKSDLFANVSHEFRTPLTLIIGSFQDSLSQGGGGSGSAATQTYLQVGLRNAKRLLNLVDQLLDVAKLDSGGLILRIRAGRVDDLLRLAVERAVPLAERERVALHAKLPAQPLDAEFDDSQLEKVFDNLISNALKFVPEGGTVRVELKSFDDAYELSVSDNGPGIPADELDRVFDRFHQAGNEGKYIGSGLGLTLAKQIVELHGGTITVQSTVGKGATFIASLPRVVERSLDDEIAGAFDEAEEGVDEAEQGPTDEVYPLPAPLARSETPLRDRNDDRAQILVVDDNEDLRAYLRRHLQGAYRVLEADDGESALELARRHRPDVVVSDIMMPKLDGRALFRHLRQEAELELIPVILVTAMASEDGRLEGLREGVDDYLIKPFDPEELLARIQNILSSRRRLLDRIAPPARSLRVSSVEVTPADQSFLEKVQRVIEEHLDDVDLSVEQLATEVGCDRSHLLRRLRALVDQTPSSLIRSMRLQRAEHLLRADAARINEVAYSVGFKSLSHFSNTFAKEYGERPSAFVARHRQASSQ